MLFSVIVSDNLTILYKEPSIKCFACMTKQHQRLLIAHTNRTLKITILVLGQRGSRLGIEALRLTLYPLQSELKVLWTGCVYLNLCLPRNQKTKPTPKNILYGQFF